MSRGRRRQWERQPLCAFSACTGVCCLLACSGKMCRMDSCGAGRRPLVATRAEANRGDTDRGQFPGSSAIALCLGWLCFNGEGTMRLPMFQPEVGICVAVELSNTNCREAASLCCSAAAILPLAVFVRSLDRSLVFVSSKMATADSACGASSPMPLVWLCLAPPPLLRWRGRSLFRFGALQQARMIRFARGHAVVPIDRIASLPFNASPTRTRCNAAPPLCQHCPCPLSMNICYAVACADPRLQRRRKHQAATPQRQHTNANSDSQLQPHKSRGLEIAAHTVSP
mmetsp:Transcript_26957/g.75804  ORF Transcript_26957/g.75804 Transcript_26957/m.75804 type:complete len:284 (+) Transcript_26957:2908-3759(+)